MGYSISTRAKTQALQKKMLAFMQKNYRNWPTVRGQSNGNAYAGNPTNDLSYDRAKKIIGLDYGALSGWERVYAYAVVRWMALKVGSLRKKFPGVVPKETSKPVPFMVYDGYESWPILLVETPAQLKKLPEDRRWCAYTPLGMYADKARYVEGELVVELADDFNRMFQEVHDKIGPRSPAGAGRKAHAAWIKKRHRLMLPHCRKKLREALKPFQAEMQRLEDLWNAQ